MTRQKFLWSALGISGALCRTSASGGGQALGFSPIRKLEASARAFDDEDDVAIDQLASDVLDFPHCFELPSAVKIVLKPRARNAHKAYTSGQVGGVHEQEVVLLINEAVAALDAPAFAQVNAHEVRVIRMKLVSDSPVFMGHGLTTANAKVGGSVNPYMSPLQATHLSLMIVDQKFLTDEYQYEPAEWEIVYRRREVENEQGFQRGGAEKSLEMRCNAKGLELSHRLNGKLESMTLGEISAFAESCMEKLHI